MNRHEEIEARLSAIAGEIDADGADIDALTKEVRALKQEKREIEENAERRAKLRKEVENGGGEVIRSFAAPERREERLKGADSKEYRSAFLKELLGQEMTREERAAFVHTTANTTAVLPTTMLNTIWDLVSKRHAIMGDITIYRTGTILEVVKHTAVAQGAAKTVAENAANDDEQNTFVKVTLSGKDFSKHVDISYAMELIRREFPGVSASRPQGTYMLFLDCTDWCEAHHQTIEELQRAGMEVGVIWQDGRPFHGACHIRMNLALPHSRVKEAFERLKQYVFLD